jgi:hypothetical protein
VDVRVGPFGAIESRENVRELQLLPSARLPVLAYVGVGEDGQTAAFMVSRDVTTSEGDGSCMPSRANCQFVLLRPGGSRDFEYGDAGETYRLTLVRIREVRLAGDE